MQLKTTIHTITQLHIERRALQALRKTSGMFQMSALLAGDLTIWVLVEMFHEMRNRLLRGDLNGVELKGIEAWHWFVQRPVVVDEHIWILLLLKQEAVDNLLVHIIMVLILLRSYLFLLSPSLQIWQLELTLGELTTCCTFGDGNLWIYWAWACLDTR